MHAERKRTRTQTHTHTINTVIVSYRRWVSCTRSFILSHHSWCSVHLSTSMHSTLVCVCVQPNADFHRQQITQKCKRKGDHGHANRKPATTTITIIDVCLCAFLCTHRGSETTTTTARRKKNSTHAHTYSRIQKRKQGNQ